MILRLAARSLAAHPVRTAVLACGFGLGVSVMATLLGVGEVILAQARAPALRGGGDAVIVGATGTVGSARYLLSSVLGTPPLKQRVEAASPTTRAPLYLVRGSRVVPIRARGGIPSLERALGDGETSPVAAWVDNERDAAWSAPDPGDVLRAMDRFHAVPDVPARAGSWAEWLYFNGRSGETRFYLTFLVGPERPGGRRAAGVRLQVDRGGRMESYFEGAEVDAAEVLATAPDLVIARNRVRLEGTRYHLEVDLPAQRSRSTGPSEPSRRAAARAIGELSIGADPGRSVPPITIRGTGGWVSGYVVPVMSGTLRGSLELGGERVTLDRGMGYHDHNWGFWEGVTWQWGQVQHGDLSFVYGRVHPPPDAADAGRVPGFLGVLGPEGPLGYAADVSIEEKGEPGTGRPRRIVVEGRGPALSLKMSLEVEDAAVTRMGRDLFGGGMDFYQLRARFHVAGEVAGRTLEFVAPGSAETFRGR